MRVVVYDETGEMALDYDTRSDAFSLCTRQLSRHRSYKSCRRPRSL